MKIGVFDSGIGGITVLNEIIKVLPNEHYIYYSDSKNNPYGTKSQEEIIELSENIVKLFIDKKCDIIVIACNTASAEAADVLRKKYSFVPIIAIEPAFKMAYDYDKDSPVLVMATKATIESQKFQNLYNKYNNNNSELISCVGLPELIEKEQSKEIDEYLEKNLKQYRGKIKNVVLGCTHFPLIKDKIDIALGGNIKFFDGACGVAKHLKDVAEENNLRHESSCKVDYCDSSNSEIKKEQFLKYLKMN